MKSYIIGSAPGQRIVTEFSSLRNWYIVGMTLQANIRTTKCGMRTIASVKDPTQLGDIGDVIHDCWFNVDDVEFDAAKCHVLDRRMRRWAQSC